MTRFPQVLAALLGLGLVSCAAQDVCESRDPTCARDNHSGPGDAATGWGEPFGENGGGANGGQGGGPGDGYLDTDGDGFTPRDGDCDDADAEVHPDAKERCDEVDNNCDGLVDNDLGHTQVQETDSGADGIPENWTYTTYRNTGGLWFKESDVDADGVIDTSEEYFYLYDAIGRLQALETDVEMDGTIDKRKSYLYDAAGRLASTEEDIGPDGIPDRIDSYFYDAAGVRTSWDMDTNADHQADMRYSYNYDAGGLLQTMVLDRFDLVGVLVSTSIYGYDYDANGKMSRVHIDLSGDGSFDNTTEYAYDAFGRMLEALTDVGRDLDFDSATFYAYDAVTGDLSKIEMDTDYDGELDTRISRWNVCSDAI